MKHSTILLSYESIVSLPEDFDASKHVAVSIDEKTVFIDKTYLAFVMDRAWYSSKNGKYFATRVNGLLITLHRHINGTRDGYVCDHINRNAYDNRSCNLREVSWSQNNANRIRECQFRGVRERKNKFEVEVCFQYRKIYIGRFDTIEEAAGAYDKESVRIFGKHAITNFPISNYDVPEVSIAESMSVPVILQRKTFRPQCTKCSRISRGRSGLCKNHLIVKIRNDKAREDGRVVNVYADRVKASTSACTREGCHKKTFARNLCDTHWREEKIAEGTYKRAPKLKYYCSKECCLSSVYLKNLCKTHWRIKFNVLKKPLGRPKSEQTEINRLEKIRAQEQLKLEKKKIVKEIKPPKPQLQKGPKGESGIVGVRLHKPSGLWKACVNHGGKEISIGYHKTKELAASARQAWVEANIEVLSVQKRKPPVRKHGLCKICGEQVEGRELCKKHYNEWYREEKFKKEGKDYSARRKQLGKERGCSIDGCAAPHKSKGLCEKHYHRQVYQNKLNNSVLGK